MNKNILEVGNPRLAWFADGDETTPETATLLEDTGSQIILRVPWTGMASRSPYERWFHGASTQWGDDPERSRFKYEVPKTLWFQDVEGSVTLVGCRSAGFKSTMRSGQGRVDVQFAVLGAGGTSDYQKINGLRSSMPGLSNWMRLTRRGGRRRRFRG